jgi:dipeptidase
MRKYYILYSLSLIFFFNNSYTNACTNILVTKGASSDGSTMITYAADSHSLYGELYYRPSQDFKKGSMLDIYEWELTSLLEKGKYLGKIRQATHTYSVLGNMNEHQLVIAETTYGGREGLVDSTAKLDYGNLIYITLQRAKTARAAIDTIAYLIQENGYYSSGESFSIADANEVWIMDIIGKGSPEIKKDKKGKIISTKYSKGAVWVALKVPDGYICAHANQSRIHKFPLNDKENCTYSNDVIRFAKEKGWYSGDDKDFSFADTYAPLNYESLRFCEARVYSIFRRSAPSMKFSDDYIKGIENSTPLPLWIKPDKKLAVQDVMTLMRDHFEGTDFDLTQDIGAGPYKCPYRWRPLTWKVDSTEYLNERAISTQQTGFSFVSQSRSWLPDCIGGVLWFGLDDTYSTVYMPLYCSMKNIPQSIAEGNGSLITFSETSAFWAFNYVNNFAYSRYSDMIVDIQKAQSELETKFKLYQPVIEKAALELYNSGNTDLTGQFLNEYSIQQSDITFSKWKQLGQNLLVKYMDGNVKDQNMKVLHPAYNQFWYKAIIEKTGDKFKVRKINNLK